MKRQLRTASVIALVLALMAGAGWWIANAIDPRLDAADKRLNTLLYAVVTLRAPIDGFYASLSEAQKTRLSGLSR